MKTNNCAQDTLVIGRAGKLLRLVRVMRILRVFKVILIFLVILWNVHTISAAREAFHRAPEPAVHSGPGLQGNLPPDGAHLCLCPHPLKSRVLRWEGRPGKLELLSELLVGPDVHHHSGPGGQQPREHRGKGNTIGWKCFIDILLQIIGSFTALLGVFILALPVPLLLNSWISFYFSL